MSDETAPTEQSAAEPFQMPSSQPVLLRALRLELVATLGLAIVFGLIGYFVTHTEGAIGGVLGAVISGFMAMLTIGSIAFANHRFIHNENFIVIFFGIVAGGWLLKLVLFIVLLVILKDQPWLDSRILFFALVAGIVVSLVIDAIVVLKSRLPYVDSPGV